MWEDAGHVCRLLVFCLFSLLGWLYTDVKKPNMKQCCERTNKFKNKQPASCKDIKKATKTEEKPLDLANPFIQCSASRCNGFLFQL